MNADQLRAIEHAKHRTSALKKVLQESDFSEVEPRFKSDAIDLKKIHRQAQNLFDKKD